MALKRKDIILDDYFSDILSEEDIESYVLATHLYDYQSRQTVTSRAVSPENSSRQETYNGNAGFFEFGLDEMQKEIEVTIRQLEKMSKEMADNACKTAVKKAAPILLNEEKRLLSQAPNYHNFKALNPSWLKSRVYKNGKGQWMCQCGYTTETIEQHIEVLIVEFGRPGNGKRAIKKHGIDKIGRKIGVVQPHSHIRAAIFNKRSELNKAIGEALMQEAERLWKENG